MNRAIRLSLGICAALPLLAQPQISDSGVTNAASYAVPQAPGAGIAPGSIFVVFGSGLGPDTLQQASAYPLPIELGGTRVSIGGASAYLLYTSRAQIAAIAPSTLAPGQHDVVVTFNGQAGAPFPVRVVPADFGIFTRNTAGYGQVAAQTVTADGSAVTLGLAASVRSGDPVVLYGTGLGAIEGASDREPPGARRTSATVQVVVGGKVITPEYAGRSPAYAGLDQINFTLPGGIEAGCYVAVALTVNGRLSNVASLPVSRTGRSCAHPLGLPESALQTLDAGGSIVAVQAVMERQSSPEGGSEGAGVGFARMDANALETLTPALDDPYAAPPEAGGCSVSVQNADRTIPRRPRVSRPVFLDAGATVRLTGPSFSADLPRVPLSSYGTNLPPGTLRAGAWSYAGSGGSEIGPFQVSVELPEPLASLGRFRTSRHRASGTGRSASGRSRTPADPWCTAPAGRRIAVPSFQKDGIGLPARLDRRQKVIIREQRLAVRMTAALRPARSGAVSQRRVGRLRGRSTCGARSGKDCKLERRGPATSHQSAPRAF